MKRRRAYQMDARADGVEQTRQSILQATYDLWLEHDWDDFSLERVAEIAGVSKQTVIRQFGSKDKLAIATVDWQRPVEEAGRMVEPGDVASAIEVLIARYEKMGDANLRALAVERRIPAIRYLLEQGRESHRPVSRWFRDCRRIELASRRNGYRIPSSSGAMDRFAAPPRWRTCPVASSSSPKNAPAEALFGARRRSMRFAILFEKLELRSQEGSNALTVMSLNR